MGKIIDAKCNCGFQSEEIYFGSGIRNYENTFYAPSICRNCNELLVKNYKFKNSLLKCEGFFEKILRYLIPGLILLDRFEYRKFAKLIILLIIGLLCILPFFTSNAVFISPYVSYDFLFAFGFIILLSVCFYNVFKANAVFKIVKTDTGNNFCRQCKSPVVFYNHSSLLQDCINTRKKEEELRWDPEELYEDDFWLPKTKYFCPKCKKMKMEFESVGFWD